MSDDPDSGWFYFEAVGLALVLILAALSMIGSLVRTLRDLF